MNKCYKCQRWNYNYGCQSKYKCEYKPLDKNTDVHSKAPQTETIPANYALVKLSDVFDAIDNNNWAFDEPQWQVEFRCLIAELPRYLK